MKEEIKHYPLPEYARHLMLEMEEKREAFLKAWIAQTEIAPSNAIMCVRRLSDGTLQTWFECKTHQK